MMKYPGALDEEIRNEENYGPEAIVDGIVNMVKFKETYPKILWILKEANWAHHEDRPPQPEDYNHRLFFKDVSEYKDDVSGKKLWKRTFKRIILCSYGIIYKPNKMPVVDEDATINGIKVMHNIALINVKKTAGISASKNPVIRKAYKDHKEFLLRQIKQIGADVIINCSKVGALTSELKNGMNMKELCIGKQNKARCCYNNEKLLIEYNHPCARQKYERYYNDITRCYENWKKILHKSSI